MELNENSQKASEQKSVEEIKSDKGVQYEDKFASVLPEWNLVPPAVLIKRVKRSL